MTFNAMGDYRGVVQPTSLERIQFRCRFASGEDMSTMTRGQRHLAAPRTTHWQCKHLTLENSRSVRVIYFVQRLKEGILNCECSLVDQPLKVWFLTRILMARKFNGE